MIALVLEGFAEVNEAMLTGESDLVQKEVEALAFVWKFPSQWVGFWLKFTM